ncbi:MAG TPA: peptidase MA family metallohydrolase, partial [candidate division Zixibacteria bacterium]|nr:peptidase MA family metallohydrolase [candidate division Zixibacteria bacterium]
MKRLGQLLSALILGSLTLAVSADSQVNGVAPSGFAFEADLRGGRYFAANRRHFAEIEQGIALAQARATELFGPTPLESFSVYLLDDPAQLREYVGGGFPDWGAAAAQAELRRIIIKAPELTAADKPLALLAAHEYAHLLVWSLSGGAAPRWLDEGLAMYLSSEWTFADFTALSQASLRGAFIPLESIEGMNSFDEGAAHIAYAQSYLAVRYLVEYYGPEALADALGRLGEGLGADEALQQTLGIGVVGFETE